MDVNSELLKINTTEKQVFIEYLTLKKPVLEVILSKLHNKKVFIAPKLLYVFALLLYYNYKFKDLEEPMKSKMLFDYDIKLEIMNEVGIQKGHLNTYISLLRNLRLLNGKQISKPFVFYPESGFTLKFEFNYNGHEKS